MSWIGILLLIIHIIACSGLILIVLLQAGKGASLGAAFGGGASQTVFGARSATFIGRLTWVLAGMFMLTSLLLTMISPWGRIGTEGGAPTILHEEPVAPAPTGETTQPVLPGAGPTADDTSGTGQGIPQGPPATQPASPVDDPMQPPLQETSGQP